MQYRYRHSHKRYCLYFTASFVNLCSFSNGKYPTLIALRLTKFPLLVIILLHERMPPNPGVCVPDDLLE